MTPEVMIWRGNRMGGGEGRERGGGMEWEQSAGVEEGRDVHAWGGVIMKVV